MGWIPPSPTLFLVPRPRSRNGVNSQVGVGTTFCVAIDAGVDIALDKPAFEPAIAGTAR
jgi:hypothetical protein